MCFLNVCHLQILSNTRSSKLWTQKLCKKSATRLQFPGILIWKQFYVETQKKLLIKHVKQNETNANEWRHQWETCKTALDDSFKHRATASLFDFNLPIKSESQFAQSGIIAVLLVFQRKYVGLERVSLWGDFAAVLDCFFAMRSLCAYWIIRSSLSIMYNVCAPITSCWNEF